MKIRDMIKQLERDGWYLADQKGSHRQYKHLSKPGKVTVSGKHNDDIAIGTLKSILKQSGMEAK